MPQNLAILNLILTSDVAHCMNELVRDPVCIIDLVVALLYLAAIVALLYRHRWMWLIYLALATAHVAAAVTHGGALP